MVDGAILGIVMIMLLPFVVHATERCEKNSACLKLFSSAKNHSEQFQYSEAQSELEHALELTQDVHLISPLGDVLLAQKKTDQAFALYQNSLAKLPLDDPDREQLSRAFSEFLLRPEMIEVPQRLRDSGLTLNVPVEPKLSRPLPNWPTGVRIAAISLLGIGAVGLIAGVVVLASPSGLVGQMDCSLDESVPTCHKRFTSSGTTGMAILLSSGVGWLSGGILLRVSFLPSFVAKW